jgi:hypothetical protein
MQPVSPHAVAIHEAIASGDVARMERVSRETEEWLRRAELVRGALEELRAASPRAEGERR